MSKACLNRARYTEGYVPGVLGKADPGKNNWEIPERVFKLHNKAFADWEAKRQHSLAQNERMEVLVLSRTSLNPADMYLPPQVCIYQTHPIE